MTKHEYFGLHRRLCAEALRLSVRKNADYAGASDPFRNFRKCEELGICTIEAGILVRLSDKFSRLATLLNRDPSVVSESVRDTILDAINYLCILEAVRQSRSETATKAPG